jgi:cell division protein FtsZ
VSVLDAFKAADQVLLSGVQGITDLITTPGLINLDFADVKSVMSGAGSALMGTGSSRGDDRAVAAAEMAISSPLLEASIDGARGVLLSIQGGSDLGLFEINEAAQLVSNSAAVDANIIFGAVIDDALGDEVRVTVIAAGLDENHNGRTGSTPAESAATSYGASSYGGTSYGGTSYGGTSYGGNGSAGAAFPSAPGPADAPARPAGSPSRGAPAVKPSDTTPPRDEAPDHDTGTGMHGGNGLYAAEIPEDPVAAVAAMASRVGLLSAPVPEPVSEPAAAHLETPPVSADASYSSAPRPAHAGAPAKTFDVAATRRRPVVFEEDDDLDVPDFLK